MTNGSLLFGLEYTHETVFWYQSPAAVQGFWQQRLLLVHNRLNKLLIWLTIQTSLHAEPRLRQFLEASRKRQ